MSEELPSLRINVNSNYYEMLGINKEATNNEIKKAYHSLAVQLHPVSSFLNIF